VVLLVVMVMVVLLVVMAMVVLLESSAVLPFTAVLILW
jgi:hypothetical protein